MISKKVALYLLLCIILVIQISCGSREIVVDKPNGNIVGGSIDKNNNNNEVVDETTAGNIIKTDINLDNLSLEEKEELFEKYLGLLGGDESIEYRQYLNEVIEKGKYRKFIFDCNGDYSTQTIIATEEEFIENTLKMIKEKYPDIEERQGEDWEYVSSMLNIGDFGSYESAFMDCDCGFWGNALSAGVFTDDLDKKAAYEKFMSLNTMKEKAQYLHNLVGKKEDEITKNRPIIEKYVNSMIGIIYGSDVDNIEIKELGITSIIDRDVRFNYILGEKVTPNTKEFYYIEDSVKGYIQDGVFIRDNNPIWTDDELGLEPESIKEGMIVQYSEKDADLLNHATQIEDYESGERFGCEDRKLLYSKNANYILDAVYLFPNINISELESKISKNLPVCRKMIIIE